MRSNPASHGAWRRRVWPRASARSCEQRQGSRLLSATAVALLVVGGAREQVPGLRTQRPSVQSCCCCCWCCRCECRRRTLQRDPSKTARRVTSRANGLSSIWEEIERQCESDAFKDIGRGESEFCRSREFDPARWRRHAAITRFAHVVQGLVDGNTIRRVLPSVLFFGTLASFIEIYNYYAARMPALPELQLPGATFELTAPLLGLLLVFRTNNSAQRFAAASRSTYRMGNHLRNLVRQMLACTADASPRNPKDVSATLELVTLFYTWVCTCYLQPGQRDSADHSDSLVVITALNHRLGREVTSTLTPSLIQLAIAAEVNTLPNLGLPQRAGMDFSLSNVAVELADCEQLLRTPIPVAYTRSLLRFLWLWLGLLPLSLVRTFEDFGKDTWWDGKPLFVVPIVTSFIALLFLTLEDISVQIEEPFVVQRRQLVSQARWFVADVADMLDYAAHPKKDTSDAAKIHERAGSRSMR